MTQWVLLFHLGFWPYDPQQSIIDFYNKEACVTVGRELMHRAKRDPAAASYRYLCFNRITGEVAQ